jgi:hypothetical protein
MVERTPVNPSEPYQHRQFVTERVFQCGKHISNISLTHPAAALEPTQLLPSIEPLYAISRLIRPSLTISARPEATRLCRRPPVA